MKSLNLRAILFGRFRGAVNAADIGLLILRVGMGVYMAVGHGFGKLPPVERFIEGVEKMGFPFPTAFAWLAAVTESIFAMMLAAGLLSRPAAFALVINMAVAAFVAHAADPFFASNPGERSKEMAMLYLMPFLCLLFTGPGKISLDRVLAGSKA
ncbi:MAG: DoxX family protein [Armatimonadetes bacterium]|nr:DoxX family protein [Armatimonadota bacterium]